MLSEQDYLNKIRPAKPLSEPVVGDNKSAVYLAEVGYGLFKSRKALISSVKSRATRLKHKRDVLADFNPWLNRVMDSDKLLIGHDATIFLWLFIWAVDTGFYSQALQMAEHAMQKGVTMLPEDFNRTIPEFIANEIAEYALQQGFKVDDETSGWVRHVARLIEGRDMGDAIIAKLYKALGFVFYASDQTTAQHYWTLADGLYPRIGVKRLLRDMDKLANTGCARAKKVKASIAEYTMSACQAAKRLGLSPITMQRRADKYPDLLPHIRIKVGARVLRRFNPKDVDAYYKTHLVSTKA